MSDEVPVRCLLGPPKYVTQWLNPLQKAQRQLCYILFGGQVGVLGEDLL